MQHGYRPIKECSCPCILFIDKLIYVTFNVLLHYVTMAYLNKLKFFPQNSFFFPLFLRIDCQNCEQLDLLVWPVFDLMTSFVQVAMIGEWRRTGDCARRVQRDVDAFYAPSRSRGKCAFSSRTLNFADVFEVLRA